MGRVQGAALNAEDDRMDRMLKGAIGQPLCSEKFGYEVTVWASHAVGA